jgi:xanthine dehydrogenase accessory factor
MNLDILSRINAARAARHTAIVVTDVASGDQRFLAENEIGSDALGGLIQEYLVSGKSGLAEHEGRQFFIDVHMPPVKLFVIGAVHVTQAFVPMALAVDLDVTIIDPRPAFASTDRFPGVTLLSEWPDEALPRLGLDRRTALLTLTHDPKIDDRALAEGLRSECFYIGALGSRKSHAQRVQRLLAAGFGETQIARLHAPVGINIGAISPAEIAVSILAEIIGLIRKDRRQAREEPTLA